MDARELKRYIYENGYVEQVLQSIECHHIKYHPMNNYWTCCNHNGDNQTAIVLYNSESLMCTNYTRQMIKGTRSTDIIDLVCYSMNLTFPKGLQFMCDQVGLSYYYDFNEDIPESFRILEMLKTMINSTIGEKEIALKPISESILACYKPYVNQLFYEDNIDYETQREFEIGFDDYTNRYTIPIRSELGDLVGVKGRYFYREVPENNNKYMYLEPCAKSKIIYGLYKTINSVKQSNRIYIGESEKFVLQLWSYGFHNSGATGGKNLSQYQIDLLIRLGVDIIFCFDKDVKRDELEELANRFPNGVPIYYMFDDDNILNEKESPSDSPTNWEHMVKNNIYKLR